MTELEVELYGHRVGSLRGTWRDFDFHADRDSIERWGLDSTVLSVAVPLSHLPARGDKSRRQTFFAELLPEGEMLSQLAQEARVQTYDTIGLLRHYGRDVAGALQIWDPEQPGEPREPRTEPLDEAQVARMLANVLDNPLGNRTPAGKTSLAGVQYKIVLARGSDGGWASALDGYPSTHIVKPAPVRHPSMIFDEEFGARLARRIGLASFATEMQYFGDAPALVIERYDRTHDEPYRRIHQEDFSQALGAKGNEKYQEYGGKVTLARIARVLKEHARAEDLSQLARMLVLSVAVGNLDMHAKNISIIHSEDADAALAPMYDVVPQAHHEGIDGKLALAVNGIYAHTMVTRVDLLAETAAWGLRSPERLIDDTLTQVLDAATTEIPLDGAHPHLTDDITRFSLNLIEGRPAGAN